MDEERNELKDKSIASCRMWKAAGKPRSGQYLIATEKINLLTRRVLGCGDATRTLNILIAFTNHYLKSKERLFGSAGTQNLNRINISLVMPYLSCNLY